MPPTSPSPPTHDEAEQLAASLRTVPLLQEVGDGTLSTLIDAGERRSLEAGEALIEEGAAGDSLYFILRGEVEIFRLDPESGREHRIAEAAGGEIVGEVALLDDGLRTASVRAAVEGTEVFGVAIDRFKALGREDVAVAQLELALARRVAGFFRAATAAQVEALEGQRRESALRAQETEARVEMGEFLVRTVAGIALYIFVLGMASSLVSVLPSATLVGLPILLGFAALVAVFIRGSRFTARELGITLDGAGSELVAALLWSLPLVGVLLVAKAAMIQWLPGGSEERLLDLGRHHDMSTGLFLAMGLLATVLTPVQEFVTRSGVQAPLSRYLGGGSGAWKAIAVAGLLFSATHMHVSARMAIAVFPLGIYWGWMFHRRRSLVGVSVSHLLIANIGFLVVGFDGFLR